MPVPPSIGYATAERDAAARTYREAGMEPPWERVYRDGRDVTDEDPATWPWPWNPTNPPA